MASRLGFRFASLADMPSLPVRHAADAQG